MTATLLTALLAPLVAAAEPGGSTALPPQPEAIAIWAAPIPLGTMAMFGYVDVPVGATFELAPGRALLVELAYFAMNENGNTSGVDYRTENHSFLVSVGCQFALPSPTALGQGRFFVAPKLIAGYSRSGRSDEALAAGGSAELGVDVGYEVRVGTFYVGPVFGFGIGYGWGLRPGSSAAPFMTDSSGAPARHAVMDMNLNLLRAGLVF